MLLISNMSGVAPKLAPEMLPDGAAQAALNVVLHNGGCASLKAPSTVATPTKSGVAKSIYRFGRTPPTGQEEALYWFKWDKPVHVARGPIAGDVTERTYFSGDGGPKKTDLTLALTGGTDYPMQSRPLGVPRPTTRPVLSLVAGTGPTVTETRAYLYTNVTEWGEESAPSDAEIVTVDSTKVVRLTGFDSLPSDGTIVTRRYIYRSVTSSSGTNYYLVGDVPASTTQWDDTTAVTAIGEPLPSLDWDVPPADLSGLVALPSGALCGFSGKEVCFSVVGFPYAWPEKFRKTTDYNIVAVAPMGQGVVVLTEGYPYVITTGDPESAQMARLDEEQACVSARSVVSYQGGVLYASPDGLVNISQSGVSVVTKEIYDRKAWQAIDPKSIFAVKHDNRYYGFLASGGFVFDSANGMLFHDITATAAYVDPVLDQLYIAVGGNIQRWDSGAAKSHAWKSKAFAALPRRYTFAKVRAKSYSGLTFKLYVDGVLKQTKAVTSAAPFKLPSGFKGRVYEIELSGIDHWLICALGTTEELRNV